MSSSPANTPSDCHARNVYLASLPTDYTDEALLSLCSKYGEIESARVMRDNRTGLCKGYGFVLFQTEEGATNAIRGLFKVELNGVAIEVRRARKATRGPSGSSNGLSSGETSSQPSQTTSKKSSSPSTSKVTSDASRTSPNPQTPNGHHIYTNGGKNAQRSSTDTPPLTPPFPQPMMMPINPMMYGPGAIPPTCCAPPMVMFQPHPGMMVPVMTVPHPMPISPSYVVMAGTPTPPPMHPLVPTDKRSPFVTEPMRLPAGLQGLSSPSVSFSTASLSNGDRGALADSSLYGSLYLS